MLPKKKEQLNDPKYLIEKIKNFEKEIGNKKKHFKSKSVSQNPFVKYEYHHPGKFIKFEYEYNKAYSCCLNDDENSKVSK